jgi:hydroxymethylbilane synthase
VSERAAVVLAAARGSEIALAHARDVQEVLAARFPTELESGIVPRDAGDAAILRGEADVAVHRMEHVPPKLPEDLVLAALLPRRSFTDALVADFSLKTLPRGARVATSNIRRRAMLLRARPDLKVAETHADVRERVRLWRVGDTDAVVLPTVSLTRLEVDAPFEELDPNVFVPSPGQGAIGCVCKRGSRFEEFLRGIDDARTRTEVEVERAVLRVVGGTPGLPVGIHAAKRGGGVEVHAVVLSLDGRGAVRLKEEIAAADALYHADEFGEKWKAMGADVLLEKARRALE